MFQVPNVTIHQLKRVFRRAIHSLENSDVVLSKKGVYMEGSAAIHPLTCHIRASKEHIIVRFLHQFSVYGYQVELLHFTFPNNTDDILVQTLIDNLDMKSFTNDQTLIQLLIKSTLRLQQFFMFERALETLFKNSQP